MTVQEPTTSLPVHRPEHLAVAAVPGGGDGLVAQRAFAPGERLFTMTGSAPAAHLKHSSVPTAGIRSRPDGLLDVVAMGAIPTGAEVTVDYAMFEEDSYRRTSDAWRARFRIWTAAHLASA